MLIDITHYRRTETQNIPHKYIIFGVFYNNHLQRVSIQTSIIMRNTFRFLSLQHIYIKKQKKRKKKKIKSEKGEIKDYQGPPFHLSSFFSSIPGKRDNTRIMESWDMATLREAQRQMRKTKLLFPTVDKRCSSEFLCKP